MSSNPKPYLNTSTDQFDHSVLVNMFRLQKHTMWVQLNTREQVLDMIQQENRLCDSQLELGPVIEGQALDTVLLESFKCYFVHDAHSLVVCFRGSGAGEGKTGETLLNALKDARFRQIAPDFIPKAQAKQGKLKNIQVHKGFCAEYERYAADIRKVVAKHAEKQLFVVGHSLGGALAMLCSLDLTLRTQRKVFGYYFGTPRVGNAAFKEAFEDRISHAFRISLQEDPIPKIPAEGKLMLPDYVHPGRLLQLSGLGQQIAPDEIDTQPGYLRIRKMVADFSEFHNAGLGYYKSLGIFLAEHPGNRQLRLAHDLLLSARKEIELSQTWFS